MTSIRTKLIILLLCCVILSSSIVGIICIMQTSSILKENARANMVLLSEKNARELNVTLNNIQSSVDTLAHYVIENLSSTEVLTDSESDEYEQYLTKIMQVGFNHGSSLEGTLSAFAVFDPAVFGEGKGFYFAADEGGVLRPRDVTELTAGNAHLSERWWQDPIAAEKSTWIHYFEGSGENAEFSFVYAIPIYFEGEFLGVIGMDFPDAPLKNIASSIKLKESGYAVILDKDGRIVTHPTVAAGNTISLTTEEFNDIGEQFAKQSDLAFSSGEYNMDNALCRQIFDYEYNGNEHFITFCTLKNGMVLCLNAPIDEIYGQQIIMMRIIIAVIAIVAFSMLIVATVFAGFITRPILSLNKSARAFIEGDFNTEVVPSSRDEIGQLAESFERTRVRMKSYIDELYIEAHIDSLTGTHNKSAFADEEKIINEQIENGTAAFSIAIFDVNYLKLTNDTFGHMAGDELLKKVATCLKDAFGPQNVFRLGGDEFSALIYGDDENDRIDRVTQCMAEIAEQHLDGHPDVQISVSVGIAAFDPLVDKSISDTIGRADASMYKYKAEIKKKTPFWNTDVRTMRDILINRYMEFMSVLSTTMDAYLFLIDINENKIRLYNNVSRSFPLPTHVNSASNTLEEMLELVHPSDRDELVKDLKKVMSGESDEHNMNYRWINNEGMPVWVNGHGRVIKDASGKPFLMLGRISDTLLKKWYNPLTGLFNKTKFVADYRDQKSPPFQRFVLINVDNLSHINLKNGRKSGDEALMSLAGALSARFPNNLIYHMEKDYFALLLDTQNEQEIRSYLEKLKADVSDKISISVAVVPNEKQYYIDADSIYEYAQHLLKSNKAKGEGVFSFFTKEDFENTIANIELINELEKSIYENDFEGFYLCYQPQIDAKTHKVVSAEVLLRYKSPEKGVIFPNVFIPLLERTHMIREVGMWVLEKALLQCKEWRKTLPDMQISVNLSPVQLQDTDITEKILALIQKHDFPTGALTLELTETVELEDTSFYSECFSRLRSTGVHIAIDDFGTGYANLSYLKKVHADQLKIDQLFVRDVKQGSLNFTLINNVVQFARTNGFSVCMEGVETVEELSVLELIDPDILQGYIFNKPIVAEEFEDKYIIADKTVEWDFTDELAKQRERLRFAYFDAANILSQTRIGLWMLHINEKDEIGRIHADDIMRELMCIENVGSTEQCYDFVFSRICEEDKNIVRDAITTMKESRRVVQVEYHWNHPTDGRILMRCTGKFVRAKDNDLMFEGFQRRVDEQ